MTRKLFATDLDGTLLDRNGTVHDQDRRAIAELVRRGVVVTIVTGRLYSGTRAIAQSLALRDAVCCVDGSEVIRVDGDHPLVSVPIAREATAVLRAAVARSSCATFVLGGDEVLHDAAGAPLTGYLAAWSPRIVQVDDVGVLLGPDGTTDVTSVIAVGAEAEIHAIVAEVTRAAGDRVAAVAYPIAREEFRGRWSMVAHAAGASKGTALRWIAAHHGVDMQDVVAVGDWLNDVSMFRVAGRSFAMGHAMDEVKAAATDALRANVTTGGGIAEAAERAGLL